MLLFLQAEDVDSDSPVTYRISSGNTPDAAFEIDRSTGVLSLRRKLGYEETPNRDGYFELQVEGSDNGVPPQLNTVLVVITVRVSAAFTEGWRGSTLPWEL